MSAATYLSSDHVVGCHCHGSAIRDEVRDWFHDIPGIFPPGEPCQDPELETHQPQAYPAQP